MGKGKGCVIPVFDVFSYSFVRGSALGLEEVVIKAS